MKTKKPTATPKANTANAAPAGWNWQPWAWVALAIVLVFWAYGPALNGAFLFDDTSQPYAKSFPSNISAWITVQRPALMLTYWVNRQLAGEGAPFGFHVVNVLIHLVACGLMFLVVRRYLEWAQVDASKRTLLAGFAAGLFLLHPAMSEAVAYVAGRSESFSTMWALAALAVFLYRPKPEVGWSTVIAVFLLFGLALASKEQTVALPAVIVLTDFWWNPGFSLQGIRRNWKLYAPMVAGALVAAVAARNLILHGGGAGFGLDITWYQYLFTQFRALPTYIGAFLLPLNQSGDWVFPFSRNLFDHGAIVWFVVLLAAVAAAWFGRRRFPLAAFGFLVYLLLMAPTSSVLPIKDPLVERRLYFGALGLLLIVVDLLSRVKLDRKSLWIACAVVLLSCTVGLHARAAVWDSDQAFWSDVLQKSPDNARAHFHQAFLYAEEQRWTDALAEYEKARKFGYVGADLMQDWGVAYLNMNQPEKAMEMFQAGLKLENSAPIWTNIAQALAGMKRFPEALDALGTAEKLDPAFPFVYLYRGKVHWVMGMCADAIHDFQLTTTSSSRGDQVYEEATDFLKRSNQCVAGAQ